MHDVGTARGAAGRRASKLQGRGLRCVPVMCACTHATHRSAGLMRTHPAIDATEAAVKAHALHLCMQAERRGGGLTAQVGCGGGVPALPASRAHSKLGMQGRAVQGRRPLHVCTQSKSSNVWVQAQIHAHTHQQGRATASNCASARPRPSAACAPSWATTTCLGPGRARWVLHASFGSAALVGLS